MMPPSTMSGPVDPNGGAVVRLLPKVNPRAIRRGFPWVYANQLVMDRRTRSLTAGSFARLEDSERHPLGLVTVNPASKIAVRMMDSDPDAVIDEGWIAARIKRALALRDRLYSRPYYRLIHAEADGLAGVIVDRFGDIAVVQPNAAWSEAMIDKIAAALGTVCGIRTVIRNGTSRVRALEGLDESLSVVTGQSPDGPVPVEMNGATYMADVMGGQKTGLYFDQRDNHAFAASLMGGGRILDVFSHVGGFGLAALAAGAQGAVCIDGSAPALELASAGARAMGVEARLETRRGDAFAMLEALGAEGETFDVVVCDPPAFAPSKQALDAGLRAYERVARLAAPLVADGGVLVLCSCSHAADLTAFRTASARGIGRAMRQGAIIHTGFAGPDHPILPQLAETGYLKALAFRL